MWGGKKAAFNGKKTGVFYRVLRLGGVSVKKEILPRKGVLLAFSGGGNTRNYLLPLKYVEQNYPVIQQNYPAPNFSLFSVGPTEGRLNAIQATV